MVLYNVCQDKFECSRVSASICRQVSIFWASLVAAEAAAAEVLKAANCNGDGCPWNPRVEYC